MQAVVDDIITCVNNTARVSRGGDHFLDNSCFALSASITLLYSRDFGALLLRPEEERFRRCQYLQTHNVTYERDDNVLPAALNFMGCLHENPIVASDCDDL